MLGNGDDSHNLGSHTDDTIPHGHKQRLGAYVAHQRVVSSDVGRVSVLQLQTLPSQTTDKGADSNN